MDRIHCLTDIFDRELEILDVRASQLFYAMDQKSTQGNLCVIGCYDLVHGENQRLLSLDGTRLYESFRTYGVLPDFFYAVSVCDDYKLRLCRIDTRSWQLRETFWLVPEGEVLNLYPVNEDYLIVTDEVAATDEWLMKLEDEDYDGKYCTLTYLYCLRTGEKWPLRDVFGGRELLDTAVIQNPAAIRDDWLIFQLKDSQGSDDGSCLRTVTAGGFIAAVTGGRRPDFQILEEEKPGVSLHRLHLPGAAEGYGRMDEQSHQGEICVLRPEAGGIKKTVMHTFNLPEDGELIWAPEGIGVYQAAAADGDRIQIRDLLQGDTFSYSAAYGSFTGIREAAAAVMTFYETEMLRDDEVFKERAAVFHTDTGQIDVYDGAIQVKNGHLLILRSFLYL